MMSEKKKFKKSKCTWRKCPIRLGFELYFQGEDDEKEARKRLYPLIRKLYKMGKRLMQSYQEINEGRGISLKDIKNEETS